MVLCGRTVVAVVMVFLIAVALGGHCAKHEHEQREHRRLDEPDEEFQAIDDVHKQEGHQEGQHEDQHFARENVSEETEGEADDADQLREEFEEPNEGTDRAEAEELLEFWGFQALGFGYLKNSIMIKAMIPSARVLLTSL